MPNTTITGLQAGDHTLVVYLNDTAGNENSSRIGFSVNLTREEGAGGGFEYAGDDGEQLQETPGNFEFVIEILSPAPMRYVQRDFELRFRAPVPLRRAELQVDDLAPLDLELSSSRTSGSTGIERLSLGEHRIEVRGVDYYGRWGSGEVEFSIVPLALNEVAVAGTSTDPRYMDDVAFSFYGRPVDHLLRFEAMGEAELEVYLNRYYRGGMQDYMGQRAGALLDTIAPSSTFRAYEYRIPAEALGTDLENIVSFVSSNAWSGGEERWVVRNVSVRPVAIGGIPQIRAVALERAISSGEALRPLVRIEGIGDSEEYDAYLYVLAPDGRRLYYPVWSEEERPLDPYYIRNNYYGRLPSQLRFDQEFGSGIYTMVAKIAYRGTTVPLSLSTEHVYYSNTTSVKIFVNRHTFSDGQTVRIEHMLTAGERVNGTLLLSLEDPEGNEYYLPALSSLPEGRKLEPISSDHLVALEREVDGGWKEGVYTVRSYLYDSDGEEIGYDLESFQVCRKETGISGSYLRTAGDPDSSPIVLSRVRVIDFFTLEAVEREFSGEYASYSLALPPGRYFLTGEFVSRGGSLYTTPAILIAPACGETVRRNLALEYAGKADVSGAGLVSVAPPQENSAVALFEGASGLAVFEETEPECSKPKVFVSVSLSEDAVALLQERADLKGLSPEGIKRYMSMRLSQTLRRISHDVEIYSYEEVIFALDEMERYIAEHPGGKADTSMLMPYLQIEYAYHVRVDSAGSNYYVFSSLTERASNLVAGCYKRGEGDDLEEILDGMAEQHGDLGGIIERFELDHPILPRDPTIEVNVDPQSVSPEDELSRKAVVIATVRDCRGRPAFGILGGCSLKVFFQKNSERGTVKTTFAAVSYDMIQERAYAAKNWTMDYTRPGGIAHGHYTLTKGTEAGEDRITIVTYGLGGKKTTATARVKIRGIGIEVEPEKSEIAPLQETTIRIRLFEEDAEGKRKPLEAKPVNLERSALLDGKLVPVSVTDASGRPITDASGIAIARFIAGRKKGSAGIIAYYRAGIPGDPPEGEALVKVKGEEYLVRIEWHEGGSLHSEMEKARGENHDHREDPGNINSQRQDSSDHFVFESTTVWERLSGRETTTASLSYRESTDLAFRWYYPEAYGYWKTIPGGASGYVFCDIVSSGLHRTSSDIHSILKGEESYRRLVREDRAGNLEIDIDPLRLNMPLIGREEIRWNLSIQNVHSCEEPYPWPTTYGYVFDRKGEYYTPSPSRYARCVSRLGSCGYFIPEGFPKDRIVLEKKGNGSYGSFHFTHLVNAHKDTMEPQCTYYYRYCDLYHVQDSSQWSKEFSITVARR
ncbi:MAG: hypothetical protein QHG99_08090 [Methanomicrobiales archaeon]|nr:hypothetical protein [Methanomicrobiales archaeon]